MTADERRRDARAQVNGKRYGRKPTLLGSFVRNRRGGVIHKFPAPEPCNVDAIPERQRQYLERPEPHGPNDRLCRRCFPAT